jgi:hypothetical protein
MIGGHRLGRLRVNPSDDRGSCDILYSRAVTARLADARQPVDRARPVENAQNAFPTRSLDAQNASTRSTGVLVRIHKRDQNAYDAATINVGRNTRPTALVDSLR